VTLFLGKEKVRKIKKVHNRLACGVIGIIYFDTLALIQMVFGIEVWAETNLKFIVLVGLPIVFILGNKLSEGYNRSDNDDKLFYIIILFLGMSLLVMLYIING
jgi:hypothetical protein